MTISPKAPRKDTDARLADFADLARINDRAPDRNIETPTGLFSRRLSDAQPGR